MIQQTLLFFVASILLFFCLTRLGKAVFVRVYSHVESESLSNFEVAERMTVLDRNLVDALIRASEEGGLPYETEQVLLDAISTLTFYTNREQAKFLYDSVASEIEERQQLNEAFDRAFAFYDEYDKEIQEIFEASSKTS